MNINEFCARVWGGRAQMRNLWISRETEDLLRVAISPELFDRLRFEAFKANPHSIPVVFRDSPDRDFTVFGIPVIPSRDINGDEVRFRVEASL